MIRLSNNSIDTYRNALYNARNKESHTISNSIVLTNNAMEVFMATEKKNQELFTRSVFESIAHSKGFRFKYSESDDGVDAEVYYLVELKNRGKKRFVQSPAQLSLQHKSTHSTSVKVEQNSLKYNLEAKTYNDMVWYKENNSNLVLVLSVLTHDTWVECCDNHQKFFSNAFWFTVPEDAERTSNSSSITIEIPLSNKFNEDTLSLLFRNLCGVEMSDVTRN